MGAGNSVLKDVLKDLTVDPNEVDETNAEDLGSGAYGKVTVVKFNGLLCASKKIHDALTKSETYLKAGGNTVIERFVEECRQLSQIRHPNIVQFLGVYFSDSHMPSLLMELLPINLGDFLEKYQNVPNHVKNSILLDVSLGLLYMHKHKPLMLHRDLTVNNILLTRSLNAKITDLGMVKVLDIHPKTSSQSPLMTICPGAPVCMPPEACSDNPVYNEKLDVFSFGHMVVHVVIQRWPMPLDKYSLNPDNPDEKICRTEVERREKFIAEMDDQNPLKPLALKCLQDDPTLRPLTEKVVRVMEQITTHSNPIELLLALENPTSQSKELSAQVSELNELLAARDNEIRTLQQKIEKLEVQLKEQAKTPDVPTDNGLLSPAQVTTPPPIPVPSVTPETEVISKPKENSPPPMRYSPSEMPVPVPRARVTSATARPREASPIPAAGIPAKPVPPGIPLPVRNLSAETKPYPVPRPRLTRTPDAMVRPHEASPIPAIPENEMVPNKEEHVRPVIPRANTGFSYLPSGKSATLPRVTRKPPDTTARFPGDAQTDVRAENKQGADPKLAALLARQKQKAEEGRIGEGYKELEETRRRTQTLSRQTSSGGSEPLSELQRLFERRRNKIKQ